MTPGIWTMGIARPTMEAAPFAWLLFIPFNLFATFTKLNLVIAIIAKPIKTFKPRKHPS
jgi:voltage-gated sodium channel